MRTSRRPSSAPTISDVARRAGVSPMTVSRVINGEGSVRAATRDAVDEAISALGYVPNPAARSLAGGRQPRIALLLKDFGAAYLSELLVGSVGQASQRDVQFVVETYKPGDHELDVVRHLVERGVGGLILVSPLCDSPELIRYLADENIPAVAVGSAQPSPSLLAVGIDEYAAAHAMTQHIVSLGHRCIGFICGDPGQSASERRLEGFRAAVAEAGVAVEARIEAGLFTYRSGLDAAERLLGGGATPTAIFASNDDMAAATVAVAHRRGLDVPRDVTVCGFDDTTLATTIWPELTTIRQPIADMARAAVDMLVGALRRPIEPEERHRLLEFTLVRRQSDAPPA